MIVDRRYAASDWSAFQNFVSEVSRGFGQNVQLIPPRPSDVPGLMEGWLALTERVRTSRLLDPVVAATASSFVFVHPFKDGNGRIHRFLIHAVLAAMKFCRPDIILPVSAAILRDRLEYDRTVEAFSPSIMSAVAWEFLSGDTIELKNDTRDLYRFLDATPQAEFLYDTDAKAIRIDFTLEAEFVELYDAALHAVRDVVTMPDRRASMLIRLCLQNRGLLSQTKRSQFNELREDEITAIETEHQALLQQRSLNSL